MATANALSEQSQKAVLESLPSQHKDNGRNALKNAGWMAAGIVGYAAVVSFFPAGLATLGLIAASTATVYFGAKLLGNASRALSLLQIKRDIKDEKFVPKLKAKAGKALSRSVRLNNFANKAFWVSVGAMVAGTLPVLAPVAAIVYPLAVLGMLGTWAASDWTKGTAQATLPAAKLVYQHQVAEGVIQPAESILPPGASVERAPQKTRGSILDIFKRKSEKEQAPPKAAPRKPVPAAPKP